jgi:hypothetical protein
MHRLNAVNRIQHARVVSSASRFGATRQLMKMNFVELWPASTAYLLLFFRRLSVPSAFSLFLLAALIKLNITTQQLRSRLSISGGWVRQTQKRMPIQLVRWCTGIVQVWKDRRRMLSFACTVATASVHTIGLQAWRPDPILSILYSVRKTGKPIYWTLLFLDR